MRVFILNLIIYRCAAGFEEAVPAAELCIAVVCPLRCATCTTSAACDSCTATADAHRNVFAAGPNECGYLILI